MTVHEPGRRGWRTSSYSAGNGGCVEVAGQATDVLVRDSKNPRGGTLSMRTAAWRAFLRTLR
ncbi:DUF397 domain-containing protein [Haloechinothrix sp. YIM 98757]|uniref:DUF397 domain-containing protein n=1 Tax=Haloechinothrix aidingensis TaxID=2752311 RepID=A0A838A863_9PSEU|nr:DUF397 domain-containing protein [Haloechinothrix aidingensis]MBA0125455.1 DUF397 domain-containing protein [Haloechinothrix aidingensis]